MSEDLNLPASLQRLEITPERSDCSKFKTNNPFSVPHQSENEPECILESLSLKSVCLKENCDCEKNNNKEDPKALRGTKKSPLRLKPRMIRRQKRTDRLLRAPMLKLDPGDRLSGNDLSVASESPVNGNEAAATSSSDSCLSRLQGTPRVLLRAPVLRVSPSRPPSVPLSSRWEAQDGGAQQSGGQQSRPCAVEARNPSPDDTSIEELASYFDLFVHIPKKMSVMAEMMYI